MMRLGFYIVLCVVLGSLPVKAQDAGAVEGQSKPLGLQDVLELTVPDEQEDAPDKPQTKAVEQDVAEDSEPSPEPAPSEDALETPKAPVKQQKKQDEPEEPEIEEIEKPVEQPAAPPAKPPVEKAKPKKVSKSVRPKAEPIHVVPPRKPVSKVSNDKASHDKVSNDVPSSKTEPPKSEISIGGAPISEAKALSLAIDSAPPAHDFEVFRQMQGDREIYQVLFKTERGPYEVQVDALNGQILYSDYRDDLGSYPTRAGHLPKKWLQ